MVRIAVLFLRKILTGGDIRKLLSMPEIVYIMI